MRYGSTMLLLLSLLVLTMFPPSSHALTAITCHCFTDRSYDPAHPAAADLYFLATTQNTFFSIVFTIDKKSIVLKKQQGISPDDLWVAYWVAAKSGTSPDTLLAKSKSYTWKNIIVALHIPTKNFGIRFSNALVANAPPERLSEAVVDEFILKRKLVSEADLVALRKAGATNQELIISTIISTKARQSAMGLFQAVKAGTKTWGALLSEARIDTKNMQHEIAALLKLPAD